MQNKRLYADIHRIIGEFELNVCLESNARRVGILGASGSGKSMTLRSIAGIEDLDSGHIEVNGHILYDSDSGISLRPQKRSVGYMFQNYALFPTMTVLKNVMAGMKGRNDDNRDKAADMLRRFRMDGYEDRLPVELSGGQQQRVALARIMVTEPELILLDEPFSALDGYLRDRMQVEMLEMLEEYPGQVIMVSHSRDELYRFSDELFIISQGSIMRHGQTGEVFRDPGRTEAARLTGCKNISEAGIIDEHTIRAEEWGITLELERKIPHNIGHVGYRAHHFVPVWGKRQKNCIKFDLARIDELPFERNYYIRPETDKFRTESGENPVKRTPAGENFLCWFVQGEEQQMIKDHGMPDYLKLDEENILILR